MASESTRSKYVFFKTQLDPDQGFVDALRDHSKEWSLVWAKHDHDPGNVHFHGVIRFASTESWMWIRNWFKAHGDDHAYSVAARSWQRCVRYLLHLDCPDKPPIPRQNLKFCGEIKESEIDMLLGRPRAYLIHDIRNAPFKDTFRLVDWLVNERGHGPGEVTAMLNCIMAVNKFVGPLSLMSRTDDIQGSFGPSGDLQDPESSPWDDPGLAGDDGPDCSLGGLPDDLFS